MKHNGKNEVGQRGLFGAMELRDGLDQRDELYRLGEAMRWEVFEEAFAGLYSHTGRPALPVIPLPKSYDSVAESVVVVGKAGASDWAVAQPDETNAVHGNARTVLWMRRGPEFAALGSIDTRLGDSFDEPALRCS